MEDLHSDIHTLEGPILLLAGPGTGKTHTLARRIKYLVTTEQIPPDNITVITFTANAALNMRERISDPIKHADLSIDSSKQPHNICTMHSLGFRIIRENASLLNLSENINLITPDHVHNILLEDAAQLAGYSREQASETKKCRQFGYCRKKDTTKCHICEQYRLILDACNSIDYNDLILLACELLKENSEILTKYQYTTKHLLIDEYQDINKGQFTLIRLLSTNQTEGLFVVGDDDQSIYSWRGGDPSFIRKFKKHFGKKAKIQPLLTSYRCHSNILEPALSIVDKYDKCHIGKGNYNYTTEPGPEIRIHDVPSHKREAAIIRNIIKKAQPSEEVLILIPNRRFLEHITNKLRYSSICYSAPIPHPGGGLLLIDRLSSWLQNENDNIALRECIEASINKSDSPIPSNKVRSERKIDERSEKMMNISNMWNNVINNNKSLWTTLKKEAKRDHVAKYLFDSLEQIKKIEDNDVGAFLQSLEDGIEPWRSTKKFLEEIEAWITNTGRIASGDGNANVKIMTIQGAKGLDADIVCIVGLEKGITPRDEANDEMLAESSRLMFVSMTRAKSVLHLFHSRTRPAKMSFQQLHTPTRGHILEPSCFIKTIPKKYVEKIFHESKTRNT